MMAQKHLHELLQEDQEPFLLKNYIADRRCQLLKEPRRNVHRLQINKPKPISQHSNFPSNFCKNACFFSFQDSPDPRKSPLFEFASPAKSPCKSPNAIFLHIPARTAAVLLEAALRIQKQSSTSAKTKPLQTKNNNGKAFGLFGSILKTLTHRNRNRKLESIANEGSANESLRWEGKKDNRNQRKIMSSTLMEQSSGCDMGCSCSHNGRPSSAVWSESNEENSIDMDLDSSCSCSQYCTQSEDFEEIFMSNEVSESGSAFASCDKHFCESPFHFVLQRSPSFGHQTPLFSSPATSPNRHQKQDKESYELESLKKIQVEEEEEGKEQCSPVSVLDSPFEDDDGGHVDDDENDLECSYAIVQRAKQQLLHKLRRFEKLAELDPIELEKKMFKDDDEDDVYDLAEEMEFEHRSVSLDSEMNDVDSFLQEVLKSSFQNVRRIPEGMKRLVSDLIAEEETAQKYCYVDREEVAKRVGRCLDSWKEVESNTIDMMVEQDLRREMDGWKPNQEQISETALEVECTIFQLLMEELSEELVCLTAV